MPVSLWKLLFSLLLTPALPAKPVLKTAIGENMSPPWYMENKDGTAGGITADYLRALAKQMNRKMEILVLPKFRIQEYYLKGKIDLNCYTSPEWSQITSEDIVWSVPLFKARNVIATNSNPLTSLEQLTGQRVGTVLKYNYPALQAGFQSKKFIRDDSPNEESNLQKLESLRFKYALVDSIHLAFYLKHNRKSNIRIKGLTTEQVPVRCWLRKKAPLDIAVLNQAIKEIKENGDLERIFMKYR